MPSIDLGELIPEYVVRQNAKLCQLKDKEGSKHKCNNFLFLNPKTNTYLNTSPSCTTLAKAVEKYEENVDY